MPNWCECDLTISGDTDEMARFMNSIQTGDPEHPISILDRLVPEPEDIGQDWYDWSIRNWGCKWSDCETNIVRAGGDSAQITFFTPWVPPLVGIQKISEMFPELTFMIEFYERGLAFQGKGIYKDGKTITEYHGDYDGDRGG